MSSVADLVKALLTIVNGVKTHHWLTQKYGNHLAMDKLYSTLSEKVDKIVEISLALYPHKRSQNMQIVVPMPNPSSMGTLEFLDGCYSVLQNLHAATEKVELKNIYEECLGEIQNTIYLCRMQ